MKTFLTFLRERIARIAEIESAAQKLLHEDTNEDGYREAMRDKAQLLAGLAEDAAPLLDDLPLEKQPMIEHRLNMFSQSARRSLDIGSVFYMSALLYPDDHHEGAPNDLERWLADLEREQ